MYMLLRLSFRESMMGRCLNKPANGSRTGEQKDIILMRFANATEQGLILGNGPIIKNQQVQTVESFRDLIADLNGKFTMKISGTPLWDPDIGSPFAILSEPDLLEKLPRVQRRATVISGSVAAPYIEKILSACGSKVPVVLGEKRDCLSDHD